MSQVEYEHEFFSSSLSKSEREKKKGNNQLQKLPGRVVCDSATGQLFFVLRLSQAAGSKQIFKVETSNDMHRDILFLFSLLPVFSLSLTLIFQVSLLFHLLMHT